MKFGKSIVTDGLIYYMDVANKRCYPGSGLDFTELIAKTSTLSGGLSGLKNGTAFSTENKGTFVLDGVNDYIRILDDAKFSFGDASNDSPFSLEFWANMDADGNFRFVSKENEWRLNCVTSGVLRLSLYDSNTSNYIGLESDSVLAAYEGQWINLVATYDGGGSHTGCTIYVNGSILPTSAKNAGSYTAMHNKTSNVWLGRFRDGGFNAYANGKIAIFKMYNKELTASELLQNYNALKARYNL